MPKFLVPMDYSKESYLAMDWCVKLAAQSPGSDLYLITVGPDALSSDENTAIQERVQNLVAMLRANVTEKINLYGVYRTGKVPEVLRDFCQEESIDLVVMTTHGRVGEEREKEGSVTEESVRIVPCPLLLLHLNQNTVTKVRERFEGFLPTSIEPPAL